MTIKVGERLPDAVFKTKSDEGVSEVRSDALFKGKRIVLFAVPGAFTPTCSMNHLPGYLENRDAILAKGIDAIVVVAVNDPHVMGAWAKATNGEGKIQYLSDGNATFTKAVGLDVDLGAGNMGIRSKRYSMLVEDGVVKQLNIEEFLVRLSPRAQLPFSISSRTGAYRSGDKSGVDPSPLPAAMQPPSSKGGKRHFAVGTRFWQKALCVVRQAHHEGDG